MKSEGEREVITRIHGLGSNVTLVHHTLVSSPFLESLDPSIANEMAGHDHDWCYSCFTSSFQEATTTQ